MTKNDFQKWYDNYHKGTYVVVLRETTIKGFTRQTKVVCRFVNYYNIESVKAKVTGTSKPREYEKQIIPHVLKTNLNTNNDLLMCYATNHHKAHEKFIYEGKPITKEQYYLGIGEKERKHNESVVYAMKLNEIVSVGGNC